MYRMQDGSVKTQNEIRKLFTNICLPAIWTEEVYTLLNINPVVVTAPPERTGLYTKVVRNGIVEVDGVWQTAWIEKDMFEPLDVLDENGAEVTITKEAQEAEYQAGLVRIEEMKARKKRDLLLNASDWYSTRAYETNSPMATEWVAYRQALRDVTEQEGFPNEITWPTQPE